MPPSAPAVELVYITYTLTPPPLLPISPQPTRRRRPVPPVTSETIGASPLLQLLFPTGLRQAGPRPLASSTTRPPFLCAGASLAFLLAAGLGGSCSVVVVVAAASGWWPFGGSKGDRAAQGQDGAEGSTGGGTGWFGERPGPQCESAPFPPDYRPPVTIDRFSTAASQVKNCWDCTCTRTRPNLQRPIGHD